MVLYLDENSSTVKKNLGQTIQKILNIIIKKNNRKQLWWLQSNITIANAQNKITFIDKNNNINT